MANINICIQLDWYIRIFYFMIRIYVAVLEYLFTWRGERKRLRNKLRNSKTYEEWINNALELDKF